MCPICGAPTNFCPYWDADMYHDCAYYLCCYCGTVNTFDVEDDYMEYDDDRYDYDYPDDFSF